MEIRVYNIKVRTRNINEATGNTLALIKKKQMKQQERITQKQIFN